MNAFRALPSIDRLLNDAAPLITRYGREGVRAALRETLDAARDGIRAGQDTPDAAALLARAESALAQAHAPTLRPVINATGVIIHTNLGRAPLSQDAQRAVLDAALGYSTLEFDLDTGKRGSRLLHAERLLCAVTGAEAGFAVNNAAAALVLALAELAAGREVVISRGQLVEIGGSFRVPDIMTQSGARLVEVGTTNRTHAEDYARALTPETALLLHVHASNFKQIGFVESAGIAAMAQVAHARGLPVVDDLGSGALLDTAAYGLAHEPTAQESLQQGADVVIFSGDKLLGGPQAGILVGRKALIDRLKRHPLARALRADKLCLAALVATLEHYRRGEAAQHVPVWQMIARPLADVRAEAEVWAAQLTAAQLTAAQLTAAQLTAAQLTAAQLTAAQRDTSPAVSVEVIAGESTIGGGSLPGETLPTALLALRVADADGLLARLRAGTPPVIARIADGRVLLDPRTVLPGQGAAVVAALRKGLAPA